MKKPSTQSQPAVMLDPNDPLHAQLDELLGPPGPERLKKVQEMFPPKVPATKGPYLTQTDIEALKDLGYL